MVLAPSQASPVRIFLSYAPADEESREHLENHLAGLVRGGKLEIWHRGRVKAGQDRQAEVYRHLDLADIIVFLISADFIASEDCFGVEVTRAMERHSSNRARIVPVLLRAADWKTAPFGHLNALPADGRPILTRADRDSAFLEVAKGIAAFLSEDRALSQDQKQLRSAAVPLTSTPRIEERTSPRSRFLRSMRWVGLLTALSVGLLWILAHSRDRHSPETSDRSPKASLHERPNPTPKTEALPGPERNSSSAKENAIEPSDPPELTLRVVQYLRDSSPLEGISIGLVEGESLVATNALGLAKMTVPSDILPGDPVELQLGSRASNSLEWHIYSPRKRIAILPRTYRIQVELVTVQQLRQIVSTVLTQESQQRGQISTLNDEQIQELRPHWAKESGVAPEELENVIQVFSELAHDELDVGLSLLYSGDYLGAGSEFESRLETESSPELQAELLRFAGEASFKSGDVEVAADRYQRALELAPDQPSLLLPLALFRSILGDSDSAEAIVRRALRLSQEVYGKHHPRTLFAMGQLASILYSNGRLEEASKLQRTVVRELSKALGPNSPEAMIARSGWVEIEDALELETPL